jgi:polyisoprenoid-binding protein YceI
MMKKMLTIGLLIATATGVLWGQGKYLTNSGQISFFSHTAIEDIKAENLEVASVIDAASGEVAIIVKLTDFQFKKKLMQEHFNENYVESEKFPKAIYNGTILNNSQLDYSSEGKYTVQVEGEMTIHGISNIVNAEGIIEVISDGIIARTKFLLNPEDYDIKIPKVVRKNIAEKLEITVELSYQPM